MIKMETREKPKLDERPLSKNEAQAILRSMGPQYVLGEIERLFGRGELNKALYAIDKALFTELEKHSILLKGLGRLISDKRGKDVIELADKLNLTEDEITAFKPAVMALLERFIANPYTLIAYVEGVMRAFHITNEEVKPIAVREVGNIFNEGKVGSYELSNVSELVLQFGLTREDTAQFRHFVIAKISDLLSGKEYGTPNISGAAEAASAFHLTGEEVSEFKPIVLKKIEEVLGDERDRDIKTAFYYASVFHFAEPELKHLVIETIERLIEHWDQVGDVAHAKEHFHLAEEEVKSAVIKGIEILFKKGGILNISFAAKAASDHLTEKERVRFRSLLIIGIGRLAINKENMANANIANAVSIFRLTEEQTAIFKPIVIRNIEEGIRGYGIRREYLEEIRVAFRITDEEFKSAVTKGVTALLEENRIEDASKRISELGLSRAELFKVLNRNSQ